jgi:hypothetical protein
VVEAKCQSVKAATNGWRNLCVPDVPANGIAVENVRYAAPCDSRELKYVLFINKTREFKLTFCFLTLGGRLGGTF